MSLNEQMDSTTPVNNPPFDRIITPSQRYEQDSGFRRLVDMMVAMIVRADYTPSELRQAAIYASIKYGNMQISTHPIELDRQACNHLRALRGWLNEETEHGRERTPANESE